MIREYILHDRGNSIFLGDSFANLPSPVGEGQTVKNFFRFNEEEDNEKKLEKENRDRNEIKIEGKSDRKTKEEIIKLNHHTNLQPLWSIENLKKGSKII
jgi:hypothetical protein